MLIGIDVGGTKTHIRAQNAAGARDLRLPTRQWLQGERLDDEASVARLLGAVARIAPGAESAPLAIGAHGCDTPEQIAAFHASLAARHRGPVHVTNDAALVGPAAGVERAVGVIAGTGSIVVGVDAAGESVTAGGHGWMIADPASAPGIVREAVRAVLARADTGAEPTVLGDTLMAHFEARDVNELAWRFTMHADIHRWAGAAPLVFDAADAGSPDAVEAIRASAGELAAQVALVLARGAVADAIVAAGGVVTNQPRLADELRRELLRRDVTQPFTVLEHPPVAGAVSLARRLDATVGVAAATPVRRAPNTSMSSTSIHMNDQGRSQ